MSCYILAFKGKLCILQKNSTLSVKEIAKQINLTFTPTYERIKHLEETGIIQKYVALVDRSKVGLTIAAYCNVTLKEQSRSALLQFEKEIKDIPEIVEITSVSGTYDYMLKIISVDINTYNNFIIDTLSNISNIGQYHSSIVLAEVKKTTKFKLD